MMEIRKKSFFQPAYYDYGKWKIRLNNPDKKSNTVLRIINSVLFFAIVLLVVIILNRGIYIHGMP